MAGDDGFMYNELVSIIRKGGKMKKNVTFLLLILFIVCGCATGENVVSVGDDAEWIELKIKPYAGIKVKLKDEYGEESDWGYLEITIPRYKMTANSLFQRLIEKLQNAFPILRYVLKL